MGSFPGSSTVDHRTVEEVDGEEGRRGHRDSGPQGGISLSSDHSRHLNDGSPISRVDSKSLS